MLFRFFIIVLLCNATNLVLAMNQKSHDSHFEGDHYAHDYKQTKELNKKKFYRRNQKTSRKNGKSKKFCSKHHE